MAKYNEILVGRWNRFIQKLTQIKGGPPASQLSGEIGFYHPFFHGTENRYLENWDRFGSAFAVAAGGAGAFSASRIRNPTGSNMIVVVEAAIISLPLAPVSDVSLQRSTINTDLTTVSVTNNINLDVRSQRTQSTAVLSTAAAAGVGIGPAIEICSLLGSTTWNFVITDIQELPLAPGSVLQMTVQTANEAGNFSWIWRERALEESERT